MENKDRKAPRSEYLQKFDRFSLCPISNHEIEWVADQLLEWADLEKSYTLLGFCADMAIPQRSLYDWEKRNDKLHQAMSVARAKVGARREELALQNKFNAGIVSRTLGVYDDRVRAYDTEMRLVNHQEDKAQTVNVMMHHMPETDVVPQKGKKNE